MIILATINKSIETYPAQKAPHEELPEQEISKAMPTPTPNDLIVAMNTGDFIPPREIEDYLKAMTSVPAAEAQDMMKKIKITPIEQEGQDDAWDIDPSLRDFQRIVKNMPEDF